MTPVQYAALAVLRDHPGIDQATLAGLIAYNRVTIGGVISRLESRGYVDRMIRHNDRRARVLTLTDRGQSLLLTVDHAVRGTQDQILAPLDPKERAQFMALLEKLTRAGNSLSRAPLDASALEE